jgi:hypothetical protein
MAADFTPLFPAIKGKFSAPGSGTEFLHRSQFAPVSPTVADPAKVSSPISDPHRAVNIEVKRDGDRISQIRVQCRCGELIEIDCEY